MQPQAANAATRLRVSTRRGQLDVGMIHRYPSREAFGSHGIPRATLERAATGSPCFGGHPEGIGQVASATTVTDGATFADMADVSVLPGRRGRGLGRRLTDAVMAGPRLQGLRRFMPAARDAHALYAAHGFDAPAHPRALMDILRPDIHHAVAAAD